jgi:hypothetical protein
MRRAFLLFVIACLAPSLGCAASLGPAIGVMSDGSTSNVGGKVTGRAYPEGSRGFAIGFDELVLARLNHGPCCDQWRAHVAAGYASLPLPGRSTVGFETYLLAGGGRVPAPDDAAGALSWGLDFALPLRLSAGDTAWRSDEILGTSIYLVPDVGAMAFAPMGSGVDHRVRAEASAGLSLRYMIHSGALP